MTIKEVTQTHLVIIWYRLVHRRELLEENDVNFIFEDSCRKILKIIIIDCKDSANISHSAPA